MNFKHGKRNTRLYRIWLQMKNRCYNKRSDRYKDYGGRGIVVCVEWRNSFELFYDWSMSHGYSDELTIDRIDNDGNYEPSNCRWVTIKEQSRNTRNNRSLTLNGETHCLIEWAEITGLGRQCIYNRLRYGWTVEDALTKPKGYNVGVSKTNKINKSLKEEYND